MYDWDEAKRRRNLAKHGVDFAAMVRFDWATAVIVPDLRRDYGEIRLSAKGYIGTRLHSVIFTERGGKVRIISLRKANTREVAKWKAQSGRTP